MTEVFEPAKLGHIESATWRDIHIGHIVRDKKDRLWTVIDEKTGFVKLQAVKDGVIRVQQKPAGEVDIYVPSEDECKDLLVEGLGASLLRIIEEREHSLARALNWRLEPLTGRGVVKLRDHITMIHGGVYVEDLLGRWQRAKEAGDKVRQKDQVDQLLDAHATMHDDPHGYPMAYPHHHAAID